MPGILAQGDVGVGESLAIGHGADNRQVVGAGAAKGRATFKCFRLQGVCAKPSNQVLRNFFKHVQVAGMFGCRWRQVIVVEIETGAQRVLTQPGRRDIPFGADHGT
ncbi:hypothetical protein D3C81_2037370 [compost metagenome]